MDWWQFAALTGTCVGTALAGMAILRYKAEELRREYREMSAVIGGRNWGQRDGLADRSFAYDPRPVRELPRRRSYLCVEVAELQRGQADLRRQQAQLRREQAELRERQAESWKGQLTLIEDLAEVRGYLRGLNL